MNNYSAWLSTSKDPETTKGFICREVLAEGGFTKTKEFGVAYTCFGPAIFNYKDIHAISTHDKKELENYKGLQEILFSKIPGEAIRNATFCYGKDEI